MFKKGYTLFFIIESQNVISETGTFWFSNINTLFRNMSLKYQREHLRGPNWVDFGEWKAKVKRGENGWHRGMLFSIMSPGELLDQLNSVNVLPYHLLYL